LYESFLKDPITGTSRDEKIEKYITPQPSLYDLKKERAI
jgi:hypothetical protein